MAAATVGIVIHSFFLPNVRMKQDVVPGMAQNMWFKAKDTGEFDIVYNDIDKGDYPEAWKLARTKVRPGGLRYEAKAGGTLLHLACLQDRAEVVGDSLGWSFLAPWPACPPWSAR